MVDVSEKADSVRMAVAYGRVLVNEETFRLIQSGGLKKGDVLTTAQIGGIMAASVKVSRIRMRTAISSVSPEMPHSVPVCAFADP